MTTEVGAYRYYFVVSPEIFSKDFSPRTKKVIQQIFKQKDAGEFKISSEEPGGKVSPEIINIFSNLAIKSGRHLGSADIYEQFSFFYSQYPLYRWVYHPRIVEAVRTGDYYHILPVTVELVPTLNCTFRCGRNRENEGCAYKPQKMAHGNWEKNIFDDPNIHIKDPQLMEKIIDRLKEAEVKAIIVTGGGEPILSPVTLQGIKYARRLEIDVGLYTNGSILTEKQIKELLSINLTFARISLNAGTAEGHRRHHNYLNPKKVYFNKILENIKTFAQEIVRQKSETEFGIGMLVSNRNRGELVKAAQRLVEIVDETGGGIDFVTYRPEVNYYGGPQIAPEVVKEAEAAHEQIAELLKGTPIKLRWLSRRFVSTQTPKGYDTCLAHSIIGEIAPDGRLYLCCERHFMPNYLIGDLKTQSFREAWDSELRRGVVNKINSSNLKDCPPVCKPHELNRIFNQMESFKQRGEWKIAKEWIEAQKVLPVTRWVNFF